MLTPQGDLNRTPRAENMNGRGSQNGDQNGTLAPLAKGNKD